MPPDDLTLSLRLAQYLSSRAHQPFDWSRANCCHLAAGWVQHLTGRHPMADLPATPDARAALRLVRTLGGSLRAAWSQQLGVQASAPGGAAVGDLLLFATPAHADGVGALIAICLGDMAVASDEAGHLQILPMDRAFCRWPVGDFVGAPA
jgi:hypothetical protein